MTWYMKAFRDVGGGHARDDAYSVGKPSAPIAKAMEAYLSELPQLTTTHDNARQPEKSVTFRYDLEIESWLVGLVGSGGGYGPAGGRQVVVTPSGLTLAEVMPLVLDSLEHDLFVGPNIMSLKAPQRWVPSRSGTEEVAGILDDVLSLDDRRRYVLINKDTPESVAVLRVLATCVPEVFAQRMYWSTAYPMRSAYVEDRIISCAWSRELSRRHPQASKNLTTTEASHVDRKPDQSLVWLVQSCLDGVNIGRRLTANDSESLRREIERLRPLSPEEAREYFSKETIPNDLREKWVNDRTTERYLEAYPEHLENLIVHPDQLISQAAIRESGVRDALRDRLVAIERSRALAGEVALVSLGYRPDVRYARDLAILVMLPMSPQEHRGAIRWLQSLGFSEDGNADLFPETLRSHLDRLAKGQSKVFDLIKFAMTHDHPVEILAEAWRQMPSVLAPVLLALLNPDMLAALSSGRNRPLSYGEFLHACVPVNAELPQIANLASNFHIGVVECSADSKAKEQARYRVALELAKYPAVERSLHESNEIGSLLFILLSDRSLPSVNRPSHRRRDDRVERNEAREDTVAYQEFRDAPESESGRGGCFLRVAGVLGVGLALLVGVIL